MAVHSFGGNALFSDSCTCEASGVQRPPKTTRKRTAEHVLGLFWVSAWFWTSGSSPFHWGLFPTPRLPAKGARRPRSLRQEPRFHAAARCRTQGPRRVRGLASQGRRREGTPPPLPGWLREGSGGFKFLGQEGVERCRKQGVSSIPHRIPSLGIQNRSVADSIQWPLSTCLATF